MPIFEYKCTQCQHEFEELVKNQQANPKCPKCETDKTEKLLSFCKTHIAGAQVDSSEPAYKPEYRGIGSGKSSCGGCSGGSCATCK